MSLPLKPLNTANDARQVMSGAATKKARAPRYAKPLDESEVGYIKMLLFGNSGAGKTFSIGSLAAIGVKLAVISTDFGGSSIASVSQYLRKTAPKALANVREIELTTYEEVQEATEDLSTFFPDLHEWSPDFLVWDGLSSYQQNILADHLADEMTDDGLKFQQQDWGKVRNGTIRPLNRFLKQHNPMSGKKYHKIVTALKDRSKEDKLSNQVQRGPLIQGAAYTLMLPAFDILIECSVKNTKADDDSGGRQWLYTTSGNEQLMAKCRGYDLLPVEKGDMAAVWKKLQAQLITQEIPA